jgi:hypothetical protein
MLNLEVGKVYEFESNRYSLGQYLGKILVETGEKLKCKCHLSATIEVFQFTNGNFTRSIFDSGLILKTDS